MDKITWIFLLLGLIIVVLLSNNFNYLEGFEDDKSNIEDDIEQNIHSINPSVKKLGNKLDSYPTLTNSENILNNYEYTNNEISKIQPLYSEMNTDSNAKSKKNFGKKMYKVNDNLQHKNYVINNTIKNINTSLEKNKDSQIIYTEYKYGSAIWGIVVVGLMVMTITTFM